MVDPTNRIIYTRAAPSSKTWVTILSLKAGNNCPVPWTHEEGAGFRRPASRVSLVMGRGGCMCDRAGLANCHPSPAYVGPPLPRSPHATGRHSSLQISTTSITYFAWVLKPIFALRGRITACTLKNLLGFVRRFLGMEGESMWGVVAAYCTPSPRKEM